MDLIYTLSKEAAKKTDDWELRMSLRSWVKHYSLMGNVYLVGHAPKWIDLDHPSIHQIDFPDSYRSNKDANLIQKLIYASCQVASANEAGLDYPFIFCSDDQGLLRPIRTQEEEDFAFQPWQGGIIKSDSKNRFRRRLTRTGQLLTARKIIPFYHDVHIPFRMTPDICLSALKSDYGHDMGYTVMSLMLGLSGVADPPNIHPNKIRALFNTKKHKASRMEDALDECLFYSISDKSVKWEELRTLIEERFSTPAEWETD